MAHKLPTLYLSRPHGPLGFEGNEKFELPSEMPTSTAELETLRTQAEAAFLAAHDAATNGGAKVPSAEDLAELDRLSDAVEVIEKAADEATADEQARADRAAELMNRVVRSEEDGEGEGEGEGESEGESTEDGEGEGEGEGEGAESTESEESLTAGAGRSKAPARRKTSFRGAGAASGRRPSEQVKSSAKHSGYVLNPALRAGQAGVGSMAVAELFDKNHPGKGMSSNGGFGKTTLASIERPFKDGHLLDETDTPERIEQVLSDATNEKLLEGESLTAAAGWCSPSEQLYEYLGVPNASDLVDLPEIGIRRGGVKFPIQPDFGTTFADKGFLFTEAEMIAQSEDKPCFEVPCDGWDEVRLDAIGLCITAGILQNKGFPEGVRTYIDGLMLAHLHRQSSYKIQAMVSKSTNVTIGAETVISAYDALLNSVELAAIDIAARHRLPYGTTIEFVMPIWARPALRNDLAKRRGVDVNTVTDAQLDAHMANRNARVQYVSDWQVGGAGEPGAATPIVRLPAQIKFLAYPAGTFFASQQDIIEVGTLYDSAMLKKNRYTALFTEDGIAVGKRGIDSRVYTVPLEYTGAVGEALPLAPTP